MCPDIYGDLRLGGIAINNKNIEQVKKILIKNLLIRR